MIAVLQRVHSAEVSFDGERVGKCGYGLMIMLGVASDDDESDARTLIDKILKLRIFRDGDGKLNLSVKDVGGDILVISNFTLMANCYRGTRPDYSNAAHRDVSLPLYEYFIDEVNRRGVHAEHGQFGERMTIDAKMDGPVIITLDSRHLPRK
ncbi:MAG: D-tyrosyl-tRNA(Tyr) deacylase [Clostridia bacterium]|nr:D-tyrosyl-tRNA(Tyr) deacylase [Clostridia bacterium]